MSMPADTPETGHAIAVVDPAGFANPIHLGPLVNGKLEVPLVRGGPAAVEQAGLGQQGRTGADRHRDLGLLGPRAERSRAEPSFFNSANRAEPAGHEQQIERRAIVEAVIGHDLRPLDRRHRAGLLRPPSPPSACPSRCRRFRPGRKRPTTRTADRARSPACGLSCPRAFRPPTCPWRHPRPRRPCDRRSRRVPPTEPPTRTRKVQERMRTSDAIGI